MDAGARPFDSQDNDAFTNTCASRGRLDRLEVSLVGSSFCPSRRRDTGASEARLPNPLTGQKPRRARGPPVRRGSRGRMQRRRLRQGSPSRAGGRLGHRCRALSQGRARGSGSGRVPHRVRAGLAQRVAGAPGPGAPRRSADAVGGGLARVPAGQRVRPAEPPDCGQGHRDRAPPARSDRSDRPEEQPAATARRSRQAGCPGATLQPEHRAAERAVQQRQLAGDPELDRPVVRRERDLRQHVPGSDCTRSSSTTSRSRTPSPRSSRPTSSSTRW